MNLPEDFSFSQASLQDFVDCRRRFLLRYVQGLSWPAVESEPVAESERLRMQGALFHHMVHQYFLGIPADRLERMIHDDSLRRWWSNFTRSLVAYNLVNNKERDLYFYPEVGLTGTLGEPRSGVDFLGRGAYQAGFGHRMTAVCDLIQVFHDGRIVIYDWKTSSSRTSHLTLANRLQTRVYLYLCTRAGAHLLSGYAQENHTPQQPLPEQIEMVYWFAEYPDQPERFAYSNLQYAVDEKYLTELFETILRLDSEGFTLTSNEKHCMYCIYRSLCNRGSSAGLLSDLSEQEFEMERDFTLDFDQIAEIEY